MFCEDCKLPIDAAMPYYWGRHGGEWHPDCYFERERHGRHIIGMWINTEGSWTAPKPDISIDLGKGI